MVRKFETHECLTLDIASRARSQLIELCGTLELSEGLRASSLSSSVPSLGSCPCSTVHSLKKFCGGLIEGENHPWREPLRGLGIRQRMSVTGSLFLFRKALPSVQPDLVAYVDKMSTPSPTPDQSFLDFVSRKIDKMFPVGWDRNYEREVEDSILPISSCVEMGRGDGGVRQFVASGECWYNRETFVDICKTAKCSSLTLGPSRVCSVDTGGKKRIVSVPDANMNFLRPLHHTLYNRLSRFPWLLRGDADPKRFKDFVKTCDEVFVSGDYESATDNLNSHVQKFILRKVLDKASFIPMGIRELAMRSLSMDLSVKGIKTCRQQTGQLMGNLLSFPLLCLVNFLAFKFVVRRHVPLRVNGDDIVFRASPREAEEWMREVGRAGLTLSPGKTMVHKRFFSLNSCFFDGRSTCVRRVPVIRSKSLFGLVDEGVMSLRDRFRSFAVGFDRIRKEKLVDRFLRSNHRFIIASGRSVRNGLMINVDDECLKRVGLYNRELCYLTPTGSWIPEVALSDIAKKVSPYKIEGWVLEKREYSDEVKNWQRTHAEQVNRSVWSTPISINNSSLEQKKREIKETGRNICTAGLGNDRVKRFARLAGCSRRDAGRYLFASRSFPPILKKPKGDLWWCPDIRRLRRIVFLSSGFTASTMNGS